MPADNELDPLDSWLNQQVRPLPPPSGTFELITRRARRRRIRKAVVSVASAAAVAAAVGVAVPVGMSLHLSTTHAFGNLASGSSPAASGAAQSALGTGSTEPSASASGGAASASGTTGGAAATGYLPPNFRPYSVTWDSLSTGWIMGPAGTAGKCDNPDPYICTSVARTDDGGQTWHGLPAPDTGGPMAATGVTGLRFLNATYGWAFGPELWATDNGGESWHKIAIGGSSVTDLETVNGRAYALFGDCTPRGGGTTGNTVANCTSYTLKTATAGSDSWTPVGGVPAGLSLSGGQPGSALLQLVGGANKAAAGYLVAPDGTLYFGLLDGSAWQQAARLPCAPGAAASDGLPRDVLLAPAGTGSSGTGSSGTASVGTTRLAIACTGQGTGDTTVYRSNDNGTNWAKQSNVGSAGLSRVGVPESLTALTNGTLILATEGSASSPGGIYLLPLGASKWQAATLSNPSDRAYGFTYVGMTGTLQGVALSGNPNLHAIWMTADGGQTWQLRPIQS
jgi:hypothetical protein